jgi:CRISPR-associated protein Csm3
MTDIKLLGRIFIEVKKLKAKTGLHIGGSGAGLEIGGVNNEIIRNPLNNQPYIPGSSLRGKMRSLTEKRFGLPQNNEIGNVTIHTCQEKSDYECCSTCKIFGVPAEEEFGIPTPTRLLVRDVALTEESVKALLKAKTDLAFAELKTEVAIDRVTSAAVPRDLERVPAGAVFGPAELVLGVYGEGDFALLKPALEALQLVEDDYLGGSGSRGSGKVEFKTIRIYARASEDYSKTPEFGRFDSVQEALDQIDDLTDWAKEQLSTGE